MTTLLAPSAPAPVAPVVAPPAPPPEPPPAIERHTFATPVVHEVALPLGAALADAATW